MDLLGGNNNNHKSDNVMKDRIKAKAAIPAAGAIVTVAILLSGLSLISSYQQQPVLAQQEQNMTGAGNATNATMTGTNGSAPVNSSPSAESLTGGTTTGGGATAGGRVGTFGGGSGTAPDPGIGTTEGIGDGAATAGGGEGATAGGGEASGGVTNTPGGAAGPQVSP